MNVNELIKTLQKERRSGRLDGDSPTDVFLYTKNKERYVGTIRAVNITFDGNLALDLDPEDSDAIPERSR
jgi:hypothetical protein